MLTTTRFSRPRGALARRLLPYRTVRRERGRAQDSACHVADAKAAELDRLVSHPIIGIRAVPGNQTRAAR